MSEIKQFSALVTAIYDASFDPSLWTSVLERICVFVPAAVSNIFLQDGVIKRADVGFSRSLEIAWNELYLTKYVKLDPTFPALLFCELGEIFCSCDLVPAMRMAQTRFYREYLQPQGLGQAVGVVLEKSVTSCAVFTVILSGGLGPVEEKRLERVRLLIPHVRHAIFIGRAIDRPKAMAETQKATLGPSTFPELLAKRFRLTPTELTVLLAMVEVEDVPEIASVLGFSQAIAETHVLNVLARTGAKDQVDLARLVCRLANPVAR
jgi:DNA-binding CsgD family transcriptional regulator